MEAAALLDTAREHLRLGRNDQALDAARRAAEHSRNDPATLAVLGESLSRTGSGTEGLMLLQRAVALQPSDLASRRLLASLHEGAGNWSAARAEWSEIVRHDPLDVRSCDRLRAVEARCLAANAEQDNGTRPLEADVQHALMNVAAITERSRDPERWSVDNMLTILRYPSDFMALQRGRASYARPLAFLLATSALFVLISYAAAIQSSLAGPLEVRVVATASALVLAIVVLMVACPAYLCLQFMLSALFQSVSRVFGGDGPYCATFRVVSYAQVPVWALLAVGVVLSQVTNAQWLGWTVAAAGALWSVALVAVGLRMLHGLSPAAAAGAAVLPALVLVCVVLTLVLAVGGPAAAKRIPIPAPTVALAAPSQFSPAATVLTPH